MSNQCEITGTQTARAALATVVEVLTEVPVMLSVVRIANGIRDWYERRANLARVGAI